MTPKARKTSADAEREWCMMQMCEACRGRFTGSGLFDVVRVVPRFGPTYWQHRGTEKEHGLKCGASAIREGDYAR